jgi:ribosomal protein S18 acetylase RimI-like enzyme
MISFQRAQATDVAEIKKLLFETWTKTYTDIYSPEVIKTITSEWHSIELLTKQIQNSDEYFGISKEGDKIIAMCNARLTHDGTIINIQRIHVLPSYQRQGIGSRLIKEAIKAFPEAVGIDLEVERNNRQAYTFYRKHGFKEVGEKVFEEKGVRIPCTIMEKAI